MGKVLCTTVLAAMVLASAGVKAQEASPAQPEVAKPSESPKPAEAPQANVAAPSDVLVTRAITAEGSEPGDSHVRIVRLSEIRGTVMMDRNMGRGPETTMQNMPVAQGMALATGKESGFAEVEFEDGSSLRLAPDSEVRFPLLVLRSTGAKASTILVDRGTVYVSLQKSKDSEFTLAVGKARIAVTPGTHLRLDLTGHKAELAVISGEATVQTGDGAGTVVAKKQTMTLDPAGSGQVEVAKGIYESPYDGWDSDAVKYHSRYMKTSGGNTGSTALYGVSDLNYYGSFISSGCGGSFWQPYFVSANWNPYSQGMWTLYSSGYSFVSPYPWGWLPYHTGSWSFCPSSGWGWQPGGAWYGVQNVALLNSSPGWKFGWKDGKKPPAHLPGVVAGHGPLRPPDGSKSMVFESRSAFVRSAMDRQDNFVFRRDSAGIGVPRGALGGLHGINRDVEHHGFANREVYVDSTAPMRSMMVRSNNRERRR